MTDLNVMMREQARAGLQTQLDAAVTNGDTAAATKIADDIAKLAVQSAPKAPPYGQAEVIAELEKLPWFGVDPKKSAKAMEFGKTMDFKKFATAAAMAEALVKAVDAEFKPAPAAGAADDALVDEDGNPVNEDGEPVDEDGELLTAEAIAARKAAAKPGKKRTDGPGENDTLNNRAAGARRTGPWTKLSDAPAAIQTEIKRSADKFISAKAPKEQRETYTARALESHYTIHQRKAGKK